MVIILSNTKEKQIIREYATCGMVEIAKKHGVSCAIIRRILLKYNAPIRPIGVPPEKHRLKRPDLNRIGIICDFKKGQHKKLLAVKYGCSITTVNNILREV